MNLRRNSLLVFLLVTALGLAACQTAPPQETTVDRVMMAPNVSNAPYGKILVVADVPSRETARNIEFAIAEHLRERKVTAHSFVRESESTKATEAAIRDLVERTGVEGVIVVSGKVAGAELRQRPEANAPGVTSEVIGGNLFGYFRRRYEDVARASYTDYTVNVQFVSDLYDVATEKRIYSVQSSTVHGKTTYEIIMAEGKAIVNRMHTDKLIR